MTKFLTYTYRQMESKRKTGSASHGNYSHVQPIFIAIYISIYIHLKPTTYMLRLDVKNGLMLIQT